MPKIWGELSSNINSLKSDAGRLSNSIKSGASKLHIGGTTKPGVVYQTSTENAVAPTRTPCQRTQSTSADWRNSPWPSESPTSSAAARVPPPRPPPPKPARILPRSESLPVHSPTTETPSTRTRTFNQYDPFDLDHLSWELRTPGPDPPKFKPPIPPRPKSITALMLSGLTMPLLENCNATVEPAISTQTPTQCIECRDFRAVDEHAFKFPRQTVPSLSQLADNLTAPFSTKIEKSRAIFVWLHHNIAYDTGSFFSNNVKSKTPIQTLSSGLAVCQGYAELFEVLARHAGLEVIVVSGHGKGYGYMEYTGGPIDRFNSNHAWNAVRWDSGEWQLIDACWGAGHTDNTRQYVPKLDVQHFTASPEIFRLRHYPTDPNHQFCPTEMSWEEYITMRSDTPLLYTDFHQMGFSALTISPKSKVIPPGPITKFVLTTKCEHKGIHPTEQYVLLLSVDGNYDTHFQVNSKGTIWTCESRSVRPGSSVSVFYITEMGGVDGKGMTIEMYLRKNGRTGFQTRGLCKWDER